MIIYVFSDDIKDEAKDRCDTMLEYWTDIDNCQNRVKNQLRWEILGLTFVYVILSTLGIRVVTKSEKVMKIIEDENNPDRESQIDSSRRRGSSIESSLSYDSNPKPKYEW